jgi:AcrR family transcriptional regulator
VEVAVPKRVDHEQRREEIASAAARLAATRGLSEVSFREVASEAGMSVANVQHYFGSKRELFLGTLERQSAAMGGRILTALGEDGGAALDPVDRLRVVALALLPTDAASRDPMRVYLSFAAAAMTDDTLREGDSFARGFAAIDFFEEQLRAGRDVGTVGVHVDPRTAAMALLPLVLGLALSVLLGQFEPSDAVAVLEQHLALITAGSPPGVA